LADDVEAAWDIAMEMKRQWVTDATTIAGYPSDAGLFLFGALQSTRTQPKTAEDICKAVRDYAAWYFNDQAEALDLLAEWRLATSEDVGRVFFALADAGLVAQDLKETISRFSGLFTLPTLFPEPTKK
jgi:uncharacterized repeat protein (TIGR04138 family)